MSEPLVGDIHPRDFLARARARLDEGSIASLFYAAFELRCGIEARLHQYLEAQRENTAKINQGWRIAKLAKRLERHFKTGDKVIRIVMREKNGVPFYVLVYTPVTTKLRKMGEMLGNYLHVPLEYRGPDHPWWVEIRAFLESVGQELSKATSGNLLGAPLWHPATGRVFAVSEPLPTETVDEHMAAVGCVGREFIAEVEYFDDMPKQIGVVERREG